MPTNTVLLQCWTWKTCEIFSKLHVKIQYRNKLLIDLLLDRIEHVLDFLTIFKFNLPFDYLYKIELSSFNTAKNIKHFLNCVISLITLIIQFIIMSKVYYKQHSKNLRLFSSKQTQFRGIRPGRSLMAPNCVIISSWCY